MCSIMYNNYLLIFGIRTTIDVCSIMCSIMYNNYLLIFGIRTTMVLIVTHGGSVGF